jgi:hypothetical protein
VKNEKRELKTRLMFFTNCSLWLEEETVVERGQRHQLSNQSKSLLKALQRNKSLKKPFEDERKGI